MNLELVSGCLPLICFMLFHCINIYAANVCALIQLVCNASHHLPIVYYIEENKSVMSIFEVSKHDLQILVHINVAESTPPEQASKKMTHVMH